jgi:hypothetical protein
MRFHANDEVRNLRLECGEDWPGIRWDGTVACNEL